MEHTYNNSSGSPIAHPEIAVVGIGGYYPGARTLVELWENVLARRQQFRQMPDCRLPLSDYYDPDPATPDTTYGQRAALMDGFNFDWANRRIPKRTVDTTDIVHWLTLEVAIAALENAGFSRKTVPTARTGVILGNTMTGEQTRSATVRLRWPFVRKSLRAAAEARQLPPDTIEDLVTTMEAFYKSVFAPVTEDSLAGSLSNTIAGRVCNYFNFDGGGYTVDGACSSSLLAIADACNKLVNQDLDMALAGGVDVSLDTFELIGFAKTGALTATDMTVYDRKASGFIPGEGCGFAVLKRLEDARRDGDYVYAVIRGWGISSDGKGGITAPSSVGQSKAIRRAYAKAGYSPQTLDFIEGHGTGTPKGDRTELEGISLALAEDGAVTPRSVGITSFKSIVGHTKAASGIGAFLKTIIAVNQRILPPTAGCTDPNAVFNTTAKGLYPLTQGQVRKPTDSLKAGTFGADFGGINCHIAVISGDAPAEHLKPSMDERTLMASTQSTELLVIDALSIEALVSRVQQVIDLTAGISVAEMTDLAAKLAQEVAHGPVRAALLVKTPTEMLVGLQRLALMLQEQPPAVGAVVTVPEGNLWISNSVKRDRVAFLFPGQGSQRLGMGRTLVERHKWAQEMVTQADQHCQDHGVEAISSLMHPPLERQIDDEQKQEWQTNLSQTAVAQPAICLTSLIWLRYLEQLGITPVAVGGHSLGELTAFCAAGAFDPDTLIHLAAVRGQAMTGAGDATGTMASLKCDQATAETLVQQVNGYVVVANINSPEQTIISGSAEAVTAVLTLADGQGIHTQRLPVSNAFHSELVADAAAHLQANAPIPDSLTGTSISLLSSINGEPVQPGTLLRDHFSKQVVSQVNFVALTQAIATQSDLMIEVGPGRVLSNLVNAITGQSTCLPIESRAGQDQDLNTVLATVFVHGTTVNWEVLYANRLTRPFVPTAEKSFIANQCECPFEVSDDILSKPIPALYQGSPAYAASVVSPNVPNTPEGPMAPTGVGHPGGAAPNGVTTPPNGMATQDLVNHLTDYFYQRSGFLAQLVQADLGTLPPAIHKGNESSMHDSFAHSSHTHYPSAHPSHTPPLSAN